MPLSSSSRPSSPPMAPPVPAGKKQPEIVVIPEKYYGVALKMDGGSIDELKPAAPPPPPPKPVPQIIMQPEKKSHWPMIGLIVVIVLLVGGGFIYFARDLLFPTPAPQVVTLTPAVKQPPSAPINLLAQAVGSSAVSLAWTDTSGDEAGYRIERKEGAGTFLPITSIPANSTAFLDVSAQAGKGYVYQVIAVGEGGESSPSNEARATLADLVTPSPPAPTLPPGGLDSDSDGLTDVEERMFGTSETKPDTDNDHYLDGNETFHLYNPTVPAPSQLIDSQLIKVMSSPAGWTIFVPVSWSATLDIPNGTRATLTSGTGELFRVSIEDNSGNVSLTDWILAKNPGTSSADLHSFATKGGLEGIFNQDRLIAYFAWGKNILVIDYQLALNKFVNYRTTFEMMLNSLKLEGAPTVPSSLDTATTGPGTLFGTEVSTTTPAATSTEAVMTTSTSESTTSTEELPTSTVSGRS